MHHCHCRSSHLFITTQLAVFFTVCTIVITCFSNISFLIYLGMANKHEEWILWEILWSNRFFSWSLYFYKSHAMSANKIALLILHTYMEKCCTYYDNEFAISFHSSEQIIKIMNNHTRKPGNRQPMQKDHISPALF